MRAAGLTLTVFFACSFPTLAGVGQPIILELNIQGIRLCVRRPSHLAMCEHTGGVLVDMILVLHRDICREDSLIGPRNYLMTKAANSLSAAAGPKLSTLQ